MAVARDLTRAMLGFGAMLRASGLPVTTGALMDAVRALEMVDLMDRAEVYLALRTVLVSRMEEQPAFDRCFEAFWKFQAADGQGLDGLVAAVQPGGSGAGWWTSGGACGPTSRVARSSSSDAGRGAAARYAWCSSATCRDPWTSTAASCCSSSTPSRTSSGAWRPSPSRPG